MAQTRNIIKIFDKYAGGYEQKYIDQELYKDSLDVFCQLIPAENASVLDLACGPGNITHFLLNKRPDFRILGTDLSPKMLELAQRNSPGAEFQLMDCREVAKIEQKFEGIICGFGLPYLSKEDAVNLIDDSYNHLRPGGILYLSLMEDDYSKSGFVASSTKKEKLYTYFHEAGYLIDALEKTGFHLIHLQRLDNPQQKDQSIQDLILIAGK